MYLVLYILKENLAGYNIEGVYNAIYTDNMNLVQQYLKDYRNTKVYRISDLTEIIGIKSTYEEITKETE